MTYLLDVNVLIALIDPAHVHHGLAHDWFAKLEGRTWATCPLTENGVIRIASSKSYSPKAGSPSLVAESLASVREHAGHVFWPDDVSLIDNPLVDLKTIGTSAQVTDSYLLLLAVSKGGRLATLDRRLAPSAVSGGSDALYIVA